MHLGISSYTFPWAIGIPGHIPAYPLDEYGLLNKAIEYHVNHLQFGDNLPLHLLNDQELTDLIRRAREASIQLEVGMRGLIQENVIRYIEIAKKVQSRFLRIVIDDHDFEPDEEQVIEKIKNLIPELKKANILLAIENHDRFSARSLERIIQKTDDKYVGICLDTANSLGAGEGIKEIVEILSPYTINLHIKDFRIQRLSHKMGFIVDGCISGKGMLQIPWLIEKLEKFNRCQTATLEVWSNAESNTEQTILKERQRADQSIEYLKQFIK